MSDAVNPQWDTVGGVLVPNVFQGKLDFPRYFVGQGGVLGSGQTPQQRIENAGIAQSAINNAVSWGKALVWEDPSTIEIDAPGGLTIPWTYETGFVWLGSRQSRFVQFHNNSPILNIGDLSGSQNLGNQLKLDGVCLVYGVSQTGNTGAIACQIGAWSISDFRNIVVERFSPGGVDALAYIGLTNFGSFSCSFRDFAVQAGQSKIIDFNTQGATSGNVYSNIYATTGFLNAPLPISTWAVGCSSGMNGGLWEQLNVECVTANRIMNFPSCHGLTFLNTHLETISLTGSIPIVFGGGASAVKISGLEIDFRCTTVDGANTYGRLVGTFGADNIELDNITLLSQPTDSGSVNLPFYVNDAGAPPGITPDAPPTVTLRNLTVLDINGGGLASHVALDLSMPITSFNSPQAVADYVYGANLSRVRGAVRNVTASYTHYGADVDATLLVPATLAATTTIKLSNKSLPSGTGSTTPPPTGNTVHVRRQSGTFSHNLLVVDGQSSSTLATNTSAGVELQFTFNGTNWVASA